MISKGLTELDRRPLNIPKELNCNTTYNVELKLLLDDDLDWVCCEKLSDCTCQMVSFCIEQIIFVYSIP